MSDRETWATRLGFILASIGSAVGLGNIWRFPFQTAENGGAAFLAVYLVAVVVIGIPALLAEFVIGRQANINAIEAFDRLDRPAWTAVGALGVLAGVWTMAYYSVVGGWVIRYVYGSATGAYFGDLGPAKYFGTISAGPDAVVLHFLFMAITVGIVAFGIEDGIEKATKLMVPSIVVLMIGLAAFGATLEGASEGYSFFLTPDISTIVANYASVVPAAVGQALFSLSLGFSVMITYASYVGKDDNLGVDGASIAFFNTFIGVLAGFVVFPLLFAQGVDVGEAGPGRYSSRLRRRWQNFPSAGLSASCSSAPCSSPPSRRPSACWKSSPPTSSTTTGSDAPRPRSPSAQCCSSPVSRRPGRRHGWAGSTA